MTKSNICCHPHQLEAMNVKVWLANAKCGARLIRGKPQPSPSDRCFYVLWRDWKGQLGPPEGSRKRSVIVPADHLEEAIAEEGIGKDLSCSMFFTGKVSRQLAKESTRIVPGLYGYSIYAYNHGSNPSGFQLSKLEIRSDCGSAGHKIHPCLCWQR